MKNDRIKNDRIKSDRMKNDRIKSDRIKTDRIKSITDPFERSLKLCVFLKYPHGHIKGIVSRETCIN
jgi:hypothetical protein